MTKVADAKTSTWKLKASSAFIQKAQETMQQCISDIYCNVFYFIDNILNNVNKLLTFVY